MIERLVSFDPAGHSVDAVQRAAYRLSDRLACEIRSPDGVIEARLSLLDESDDPDRLVAEFRNEVLDQVLRERIRAETADVRNLVLALAFSRTGLTEADG
ncbi:MAG TPA: His-Xaa-Ser system protein HxsD [Solirubrobacterales bacterium]|nr:His-Xaa-Ser system protein HxsD [Solirubrobacterales bacterium]